MILQEISLFKSQVRILCSISDSSSSRQLTYDAIFFCPTGAFKRIALVMCAAMVGVLDLKNDLDTFRYELWKMFQPLHVLRKLVQPIKYDVEIYLVS